MPQKNLADLKLVNEFLDTLGGKELIDMMKICEKKRKAFTDEDISKKMGIKVTEVRAMLNKLHYRGIACYQKSRNQKTGWFNYTWEIKKDRLADIIINEQREILSKLNEKKSLEGDYNFFDCNNCTERLPFEVAAEYNFMCPSCGGVMDNSNDPKKHKQLEKEIKRIEEEISFLSELK
jgi:transcription initiation factor TFIIE subunit alpha